MKTFPANSWSKPKRKEEGLATMLFIALLAILLLLVSASSMVLIRLHHEVRFLEQQQIKRLNSVQTNSAPANLNIKNLGQQ